MIQNDSFYIHSVIPDIFYRQDNRIDRAKSGICDHQSIQIQTDQKITCEEELKSYMEKLELKGEGGTDFRPAFAYVDEMIRQHAFEHLRGMIYFTDGRGIYPAKRPVYETAFVFMEEEYEDVDVPPWAIKIILEEGQDF